MKLSEIIAREEAHYSGKWFEFNEWVPGLRLKIRPMNNPDFRRLKFESETETSSRDFNIYEMKNARILAEAILSDWEGIEDDNEKPLAFSHEKALEILSLPVMEELRLKVVSESVKLMRENQVALEADAKN